MVRTKYALLLKALKQMEVKAKPKITAKEQLVKFMAKKQGYKVINEKAGTYTRKDGKVINTKVLTFDNGKDYCVTPNRFWKLN